MRLSWACAGAGAIAPKPKPAAWYENIVRTRDDSELDLTGFAESLDAESVLWTRAAGVAETTVGGFTEILDGDGAIHEELGELRFRLSPDAWKRYSAQAEVRCAVTSSVMSSSLR